MATPTSSAPRAKAALMRLFAADSTLSGVKALWGPVNPKDRVGHEIVMLGRIPDGLTVQARQEAHVGNGRRSEEYTIFVTIAVSRGGYDFEALDTRAFELLSALEVALKADPSLDAFDNGQPIGQPFQCIVGGYDQSNFPALEGGGASQIVVDIDCQATLRTS